MEFEGWRLSPGYLYATAVLVVTYVDRVVPDEEREAADRQMLGAAMTRDAVKK